MLYRGLRKAGVYEPQPGWLRFLVILVLANAALSAIAVWLMGSPEAWLEWQAMARISWMSLIVGAGILVYFTVLILAGLRLRHIRGELF
jgi:putative peptidoglycan lipid II flippase